MTTLKTGDNSADVKSLQQALSALGYTTNMDGVFSNDTQKAVMQFQRDHKLSPDGIAGPNTWAVITDLQSTTEIMGIDVSHYNGLINWNNVPKEQVKFVYCKASQGATYKDEMLHTNINELTRLGFIFGAYHFFTFLGASAADQANNFLGCGIDFAGKNILPPVIDIEWQQSDSLNQSIIQNRSSCIDAIRTWLDTVKQKTGKAPIIYTNSSFWHDYLGNPIGFSDCLLWIASYRNDEPALPPGWNNYTFWQFTQSGSVPGITGNVDKDKFNGDMTLLTQLSGASSLQA